MKILITGASGMLGRDLILALEKEHELIGVGRPKANDLSIPYHVLNLHQGSAFKELCEAERPEIIFHAAAMTEVDQCEVDQEQAFKDNVGITSNVAEGANRVRALLIFFSTDYIFNGAGKDEIREGDSANPVNYYGETKLLAENHIRERSLHFCVFRISWLFGLHKSCFPEAILKAARQKSVLPIVDDQYGRPTYAKDVALAFSRILQDGRNLTKLQNEVFHLSNQGMTNWADYAEFILQKAGCSALVKRISSAQLGRNAQRPKFAVLSIQHIQDKLGIKLRSWQDAVTDYLTELRKFKSELFV